MGPLAACLASVRLLEGTFESIIQLIILLSYISFWKIYFSGSRGDITFSAYDLRLYFAPGKYSYYYGVAQSILSGSNRDQAVLYLVTMALSLTYPVTSYVNHTDTVLQVTHYTPPSQPSCRGA